MTSVSRASYEVHGCPYSLHYSSHVWVLFVLRTKPHTLCIYHWSTDPNYLSVPSCCCIVMSAWTVLLFYFNNFYWCILPYVYYCSCNSRPQVADHGNSFKNSVTSDVVRCNSRAAWVWHSRRLAVVGPVSWSWIICTLLANLRCVAQTLNLAVSGSRRPNITWRV